MCINSRNGSISFGSKEKIQLICWERRQPCLHACGASEKSIKYSHLVADESRFVCSANGRQGCLRSQRTN